MESSTHHPSQKSVATQVAQNTHSLKFSIERLQNSSCSNEKRTHIQLAKERLRSLHELGKTHAAPPLSDMMLHRIEQEIHRVEQELAAPGSTDIASQQNPRNTVEQLRNLLKYEKFAEAEQLLIHCIRLSEKSSIPGIGVSSWYYEKLAEVFHSQQQYEKEVLLIENYLKSHRAPHKGRAKLYKQLQEAQRLSGYSRTKDRI